MLRVVDPENHKMLAENVERDDNRLANQTGGTASDQRLDFRIDAADRSILWQQMTYTLIRRDVKHTGDDLNGADPEASIEA